MPHPSSYASYKALPEWQSVPRGNVFDAISWLLVGSILLGFGVAGLARGQWLAFTCGCLVFTGMGLFAYGWRRSVVLQRLTTPDVETNVRTSGRSLILERDNVSRSLELWGLGTLGVGALGFGIGVSTGRIDLAFVVAGPNVVYPTAASVAGIAALVGVVYKARKPTDAKVLSPVGVRGPTIRDKDLDIAWSEMVEPRAVPTASGKRAGTWLSLGTDGGSDLRVDTSGVGASAAFWLVDFYWRHPELRSELTDSRAVARMRDGGLVTRPRDSP